MVILEHTVWSLALQKEHTFYPSITVSFFGRGRVGRPEGRGKGVTRTTLEDRRALVCGQELTERKGSSTKMLQEVGEVLPPVNNLVMMLVWLQGSRGRHSKTGCGEETDVTKQDVVKTRAGRQKNEGSETGGSESTEKRRRK